MHPFYARWSGGPELVCLRTDETDRLTACPEFAFDANSERSCAQACLPDNAIDDAKLSPKLKLDAAIENPKQSPDHDVSSQTMSLQWLAARPSEERSRSRSCNVSPVVPDANSVPARVLACSGRAAHGSRALPTHMGMGFAHGSTLHSPPTSPLVALRIRRACIRPAVKF